MDAVVKIGTIVMFCDESVLGIQFGNGYSVAKIYLADLPYKDTQMYTRMKDFYRFRSESLHEGDDQNITEAERLELEGIVRRVLNKCLQRCKAELAVNPSITWNEIKAKIIDDLKTKVTAEVAAGTFGS